jgi:hypothetical protein
MFQDRKHSQTSAGSALNPWTDPASCRRASADECVKLFDNFRFSAFRLETLDQYIVAGEWPEFQAYLAGDTAKNTQNKAWTDYISEQHRQGKTIERVHIIPENLTDYLKFQIDWGYRYSQLAGETIQLVYREALPQPLNDLRLPDFWLFDDSQCLIQRYDKAGTWMASDILLSNEGIQTLRSVRDELMKMSFPLKEHPHVRW